MNRKDRIKLNFIRNWKLPGQERLSHYFSPSPELKSQIKDGIVWLGNEDIAIHTTADNYIEWTILATGNYEDEVSKLIRVSVRPGDICLDIGGNIGLHSIRMALSAGLSGKVLTFEPLDHLRTKLEKNLSLNRLDNVEVYPYALSDTESEAVFPVDKDAWNQGEFSLGRPSGAGEQQVSVKIADQVPAVSSLPSLSLVKIDVEGFEFHVLRGLRSSIEKHRPRIIFEYDSNHWPAAGQNIADCYIFLKSFNYELYQITPVGCELIHLPGQAVAGNIFCLPV